MICSECGSYQPARAKFCGMCGAGLSQEGLVESFLGDGPEADMTLPRHRSFLFYAVITMIVIAMLAVLAGAGYVIYLVAWGGDEPSQVDREVEDKTQFYSDDELGFSISYPVKWSLGEGLPSDDELIALTLSLTARKVMEVRAFRLDPLVSIGGIKAIEEYLDEDAMERILSLGGMVDSRQPEQPGTDWPGYGQEEAPFPPEDEDTAAPGEAEDEPLVPARPEEGMPEPETIETMFKSSRVSGLPAFHTEFTANYMGEETGFILYYVVASDLVFVFQGRAPSYDYERIRPQLYSIIVSLKWEGTPQ